MKRYYQDPKVVPNYRRNLMKSIIGMVLLIATLITACWSCGPALINKYGLKDKEVPTEKWKEIQFAALLSK